MVIHKRNCCRYILKRRRKHELALALIKHCVWSDWHLLEVSLYLTYRIYNRCYDKLKALNIYLNYRSFSRISAALASTVLLTLAYTQEFGGFKLHLLLLLAVMFVFVWRRVSILFVCNIPGATTTFTRVSRPNRELITCSVLFTICRLYYLTDFRRHCNVPGTLYTILILYCRVFHD